MPHTSSSGMSHRHVATAAHFLILTFIVAGVRQFQVECEKGDRTKEKTFIRRCEI